MTLDSLTGNSQAPTEHISLSDAAAMAERGKAEKEALQKLKKPQSVAEVVAAADQAFEYFMLGTNATPEYKKAALEKLQIGADVLLNHQEIDDAKTTSTRDIALAAVAMFSVTRTDRWGVLFDALQQAVNAERTRQGDERLTFDIHEPLSMVKEKLRTHYSVGEKSIAKQEADWQNQDATLAMENGTVGVFDGLTNVFDGALAAQVSKETYAEVFGKLSWNATVEEVKAAYFQAADLAKARLRARRKEMSYSEDQNYWTWRTRNMEKPPQDQQEIFGTTMGCARLVKDGDKRKVVYSYVGDTRVYVVKNTGRVVCLTTDDGLLHQGFSEPKALQDKLDNVTSLDGLNAVELKAMETRHMVGRTLSDDFDAEKEAPSVGEYTMTSSDIAVFVSSDGVHDNLTRNQIQDVLLQRGQEQDERVPTGRERLRQMMGAVLYGAQEWWRKRRDLPKPIKPLLPMNKLSERFGWLADAAFRTSQLPEEESMRAKPDDISLTWILRPEEDFPLPMRA